MATNPSDVETLVSQEPVGAGSEPALEGDEALFAEIATHDEYAEPSVAEPSEPTPSGEVVASEATDAQQQPAVSPASAVPTPPSAPEQPTPLAAPPVNPEAITSPPEQPTPASVAAPEPSVAPSEPLNFEKHRAETLPRLEELYKLTDEEVEEARLEPDKALPKLAARLHYEVTTAVFNSVLGSLPQFVHQTLEVRKAETAAEDSFYSRWPDLKDEKHKPVVVNSIKAYRQANPRATMAEVIDRAGLMAMLSLGINPQPQQPQQQQPQAVPQPMPVPPLGAGAGGAPFAPRRMTSSEDDVIAGLIDAEQRGELY